MLYRTVFEVGAEGFTAWHTACIPAGLSMRIAYVDQKIIRLEISDIPGSGGAAASHAHPTSAVGP
jgi:hypothetical protein